MKLLGILGSYPTTVKYHFYERINLNNVYYFFSDFILFVEEWVELYSGSEFDKVEKSQMAGPWFLYLGLQKSP